MRLSVFALLILTIQLNGCRDRAPAREHVLRLRTESDPGVPLSDVAITLDGAEVGRSRRGLLQTTVATAGAELLRLHYDCPPGHHDPSEPVMVRVRPFQSVRSSSKESLQVTLRCPPTTHVAAFVIRVRGVDAIPVLLDGAEVATAGTHQAAFLTRRAPPGTEFVVDLDTRSDARLAPQRPSRVFTLGDQHEVFVFDQVFSRVPRPRRRASMPRIIKIE